MNTSTIEQTLLEERKYWQGVADHMVESASMDVNSKITFDVAQQKTARIDRALKQIKAGTFGQCEKCRTQIDIDPERLKTLINSDCHFCAHCAKTTKTRTNHQPERRTLRPAFRHAGYAMEPA